MIVHFFGNVFGIGFGNVSESEYNISPETVPGKHILHISSQNQHFAKIIYLFLYCFTNTLLLIFEQGAKAAEPCRGAQPP